MTSKVLSAAYSGLHCQLIDVEADISRHLPAFVLVGLPDTAVQEARERIRSALDNSGLPFPRTKVTVNLAPANVRKEGSFYDLAIAIGILLAQKTLTLGEEDRDAVFLGELSLSGKIRPVPGILLTLSFLKKHGITRVYVPHANATEASYCYGLEVYTVKSLKDVVNHLTGAVHLAPVASTSIPEGKVRQGDCDFSEVHGQQQAKRALEIAAAGNHNVLLHGVPGSGKTMLARSFVSILPPMNNEEVLDVSKIYSCAGLLNTETPLIDRRPFRSPHHTASVASIIGGGTWPRPGEITLAHRGVLFLDEFPEFPRAVLESLRQPLEDKVVTVSRAAGSAQFPAHFTLLAAQNPCPCGAWGDTEKLCICTDHQRRQYHKRISGPLLDRIDLHVRVPAVKREDLLSEEVRESSIQIRERVVQARERQHKRFEGVSMLNGDMSTTMLKRFCRLDNASRTLLIEASKRLQLSARGFYKIIKISRTIADLSSREHILEEDILEALQYRPVD